MKDLLSVLMQIVLFAGLTFWAFAQEDNLNRPPAFKCVELSKKCAICTDGKKHPAADAKSPELTITDYECAQGFAGPAPQPQKIMPAISAKLGKCIIMSDFCAICADGLFISTLSGNKIDSDLYECVTSPRTMKK
ncbi:MAG: hypothetical protein A2504_09675 [Bdellovibrionales bacterium RIFOXYD12_FULL_39_22]|nr:MAG: hypothetical protein A2385_13165 [Bdellovibrionales bacterium RIFOXYB1_FULL_39_21]OFZ40996.1 MAG: hypothetical protein A2485_16675 [Bdellovibrionales bacterium RIFOXYC12_FULL_39_17]OFZ44824.1 MAG: hypothetical protein A2404_09965 [Bdellovibrionales bacterium RIFOXYC1_FULL_39_130]OFZ68384.1 MAG: hypothetical protein A2451_07900 [Bdellovibrionales bacterium RIFOXYC2_FULL_39_8]OFZ74289.1 MAG: hypothetical protein A2560_16930 [Bdellovibrionales bacterium RIFOXYD1_FULL_39_84]OFZ92153.1 MAG: